MGGKGKREIRRSIAKFAKYGPFYVLFAPVAVYFLLFSYYPFFKGILMSFQANRIIPPRPFVGVENYAAVMADPDFWSALVNSLVIGLADMALYFCASLLLALCINEISVRFFRRFVQTVAFIPYLFSWAVIGGVWALLFDRNGMVNAVAGLFGAGKADFLASQSLARILIVGMGVWRSIGYFAVLFGVAILAIDPTLFEAARIDGAGRMQQVRRIIVPSLASTAKVIVVLLAMGVLTHFDEVYVMQNAANKDRIRTLLLFVYDRGILQFKTGLATAGAALVMAGSLLLVAATRRLVRYDED